MFRRSLARAGQAAFVGAEHRLDPVPQEKRGLEVQR